MALTEDAHNTPKHRCFVPKLSMHGLISESCLLP